MSKTEVTSTRKFIRRDAWISHIESYKTSGLSQVEFAQKHDLNLATFRNWIHRLHQESQKSPAQIEKPAFLPVSLTTQEVKAMDFEQGLKHDIHVSLPNGIQCRFTAQHNPKLIVPWIEYLRVLP
jgi:transposase-like protein